MRHTLEKTRWNICKSEEKKFRHKTEVCLFFKSKSEDLVMRVVFVDILLSSKTSSFVVALNLRWVHWVDAKHGKNSVRSQEEVSVVMGQTQILKVALRNHLHHVKRCKHRKRCE
jgi:hypothetical protein